MSLSQNEKMENLLELANGFEILLGENDIFTNFMLRRMLRIRQQNRQVILFPQ